MSVMDNIFRLKLANGFEVEIGGAAPFVDRAYADVRDVAMRFVNRQAEELKRIDEMREAPAALPAPATTETASPGTTVVAEMAVRPRPVEPPNARRARMRSQAVKPKPRVLIQKPAPTDEPAERAPRRVVCLEKPGKTYTPAEAAEMAGVKESSLRISLSPTSIARGSKCGGYSFRWADTIDLGEARPRHSLGTSMPVNPHVRGAAAKITHADGG